MPDPHVIRLHGPWQFVLRPDGGWADAAAESLTGRFTVPGVLSRQIPDGFCGCVRLSRSFHCPTGLTDAQRVELLIQSLTAPARVVLNDRMLGVVERPLLTAAFEVGPILQEPNQLHVEFECRPGNSLNEGARKRPAIGITGTVQLQIHPPRA